VEVSAGRQERDQKMSPQPKPSSQDYQGRTRKEVLAQIGQLNQLVEASKTDGEAGVGVRRDALERILSLAMSISEKDIILSATAMLKAVMEQDTAGLLTEAPPEGARRQTQVSGSPQKPLVVPVLTKSTSGRISLSPAPRKLHLRDDDRSRSSSMMTGRRPERKSDNTDRSRPSNSPNRVSSPSNPSSPGRGSGVTEPASPRSCTLHHLPLRFYDQQCGLTLCQECTATTHKDHVVVSLFGYAAQCRQELAETLAAARKVLGAAEKAKLEEQATKVALP